MSNIQSYNALIDRFKAFASGHFILKTFSHGQIDTADLEKFTEYPFMHVVPSNVTYAKGTKTFSFQIVLADLPRDKDDKVEFQREVLSDLQRIAEDLVAEITNHRVLFGDLITVQNVSLEPFLEEFHNTLTGWTVSLELLVPYYWDACSIPAEWNDMWESSTGGTGSILTFIDSIVRDENGNVSLVNDEATPAPNYYYGTNNEGVRGWYLLTDEVGLTCETIGTCQTIIDIESAIDDLQTEILLKADITSISAVGFSNDYNDLDNLPTIPTATSDLTNDGADGVNPFITAQDLPSLTGYVPYTGATTDVDLGTHNLTADHIALNVSPSGAGYVVGATQWNNTIGSSETLLKGGTVSLKNGVDLVARIVNKVTPNTTLTKAAYQAVRVSGAQGQRLAVELAQANNDNNSADTIGIVCETIATNQEGFIQTVGQLESINTTGSLQGETWADGDVLYLSPTTAGALTNIKPTGATGHIVVIGYVEYAHANNGKIYVKIMNGWELDELHNVYITSPANNNVLTYESSTSLWKNKTVETALGFTPVPTTRTLTINGTTQDLSANRTFTIATGLTVGTTPITSGAVGRVLFEGTGNVLQESANLFWDNTNSRLGIGTDLGAYGKAWVQQDLASTTDYTLILNNRNTSGAFSATGVYFANGGGNATQPYNVGHIIGSIKCLAESWNNVNSRGSMTFNLNNSSTVQEEVMRLVNTTKNVLIGTTTDAGFKLDVNGTARIATNLTVGSGPNTTGNVLIGRALAIGYVVSATASSPQSFILGGTGNTLNLNSFVIASGGYANTLGNVGVCRYVLAAAPTSVGANSVTNLYVLGTETLKLNDGTSSGVNSLYNAGIITVDLTVMEVSLLGNSNVYVGKFVFRFKRYLINGVGFFTDISAVTNLYNSADATLIGTTLQAVANGTNALDLTVTLPATANTANYRMGANVTITKVNNS